MKSVTIYTDGGCDGNPGPGGWAAILVYGAHRKELSGGSPDTTNNRMEMQAAIEALTALKEPCTVDLHTDSQYLAKGISQWLTGWKKNGWKTRDKSPVKNEALWRRLDDLTAIHQVRWKWLKGHAGHRENERCDQLASVEIRRVKRGNGRHA